LILKTSAPNEPDSVPTYLATVLDSTSSDSGAYTSTGSQNRIAAKVPRSSSTPPEPNPVNATETSPTAAPPAAHGYCAATAPLMATRRPSPGGAPKEVSTMRRMATVNALGCFGTMAINAATSTVALNRLVGSFPICASPMDNTAYTSTIHGMSVQLPCMYPSVASLPPNMRTEPEAPKEPRKSPPAAKVPTISTAGYIMPATALSSALFSIICATLESPPAPEVCVVVVVVVVVVEVEVCRGGGGPPRPSSAEEEEAANVGSGSPDATSR